MRLLLRLAAITFVAGYVSVSLPGDAQPAAPAAHGEARQVGAGMVVLIHVEAIRNGDGERALAQLAPSARQRFPDGAAFLKAMEVGHAVIQEAEAFALITVHETPAGPAPVVALKSPDGRVRFAVFEMEHQPFTGWQVERIIVVEPPPPGIPV